MSIFTRMFSARDKPEEVRRAKDTLGGSRFSFFFGSSTSGKPVNERTAMQMTAVYSCVRILSEAVAGLPLHVYRYGENGSKEKALDHPLYLLLHDEPNPEMTSFNFRETLMGHLLFVWERLRADHPKRQGRGDRPLSLMPTKMTVDRDSKGTALLPLYPGLGRFPRWMMKTGRFICRRSRCFISPVLAMTGSWAIRPSPWQKRGGDGHCHEEYGAKFFRQRCSARRCAGTSRRPEKPG